MFFFPSAVDDFHFRYCLNQMWYNMLKLLNFFHEKLTHEHATKEDALQSTWSIIRKIGLYRSKMFCMYFRKKLTRKNLTYERAAIGNRCISRLFSTTKSPKAIHSFEG